MRLFSLILFFSLLSCSSSDNGEYISGFTMGTTYSVQWAPSSHSNRFDPDKLQEQIDTRLDEINQLMSTYDSTSQLSKVNQSYKSGWHNVDEELAMLLDTALEICEQSQGAFDITAGPLIALWGFGSDDTRFSPPTRTELDIVSQNIGCQYLNVRIQPPAIYKNHQDTVIDLSAIAKGYAVDQLAEILDASGMNNYLIEIGGELRAKGLAPHGEFWRIGIEAPNPGRAQVNDILSLNNVAVATSGNYRNYFEHEGIRYSHIIDPRIGMPIRHKLSSVTVIHENAAMADAWATALLVLGPNEALAIADRYGLAIYMITEETNGTKSTYNKRMEPYIVR